MPARTASPLRIELPGDRIVTGLRWGGRGVPVVLLHGLLDSSEGWSQLAGSMTRPCYAIDLAGFGGSSPPLRPSLRAFAEDVAAALDELGIKHFVLVGHSFGGGVAAALSELMPKRIEALVLLAPAGFGRIPLAEAISLPGLRNVSQLLLPFALGNRLALGTAYRVLIANGASPAPGVLERVIDRHGELVPGAREATKAIVRAGLSPKGFRHRILRYRGPVDVVWGDRDRMVPRGHLAGVAAAYPQLKTEIWPNMGHHPQRERPRRLANLVDRVCRDVKPVRLAKAA